MELIDTRAEEKEELQNELVHLAKKHKLRRKLVSVLIVAAIFIGSILSAWLAGRIQMKNKLKADSETPVVVNSIAPEIVLDIISSELKNIGELATIEYLFTDAAKFSDSKQIKDWNIPLTEKSFTLKWDGKIKAGVKIDEIDIDITATDKKIRITLPPAEILSYEIDNNSVEILDEKDNIFNNISIADKVKLDAAVEEEMKQRAIDNGLLEMAQANAEGAIAKLLCVNPDITSNYTIEFVHK